MKHIKREFYGEGIGICLLEVFMFGLIIASFRWSDHKVHPILGTIVIVITVLIFIHYTCKVLKGWDYKVNEYLLAHPETTMEVLLEDSKNARRFNCRLSISPLFLFFMEDDLFPRVICKKDIKHLDITPGQGGIYLMIEDRSGERYEVWMRTKRKAKKAIRIIEESN